MPRNEQELQMQKNGGENEKVTDGQLGRAKLREYLSNKFGQANQVDYKFYSLSKKGKMIAFILLGLCFVGIVLGLWFFIM